jgi:hypothetical protein
MASRKEKLSLLPGTEIVLHGPQNVIVHAACGLQVRFNVPSGSKAEVIVGTAPAKFELFGQDPLRSRLRRRARKIHHARHLSGPV